MDAPFQIRPAAPTDAPRLAQLERECFTDPWSEAGMREVLEMPSGCGMVAHVGTAIQGYVLARSVADTAEILNLAVAPSFRRHRMASRLLEAALAELKARGVAEVFLEVRHSNHPALALYRDWGFRVAGMRRAYYRSPVEDALVLRRPLEEGA